MKYNAFISYSHAADGRMAPALQAALERFAKPWYKLRYLNIFRDETSLSASPHLWTNIQKALDESEYLIYMASPESAASKWVSKEIEYWLEKKSLDTFLIVLSDGDLTWDDANNKLIISNNNSLPPLLYDEFKEHPFYIDLREMRSETDLSLKNPIFKKEVLKLAAQLHGKAPKDLASEEVSTYRKMVWTRNSATLLLILLLVFSFLSLKVISTKEKENLQKGLDIEKEKQANILTNKKLENQKLTTKIKDDSLKSTQEQKLLSEKLALTRKLLADKMIENTKTTSVITLEMNRVAKLEISALQNKLDSLYQLLKSQNQGGIDKNPFGSRIYFDFDRFNLSRDAAIALDNVVSVLRNYPQFTAHITVPYYFSFIEEKTMEWLNEFPKIKNGEEFETISTVNNVISRSQTEQEKTQDNALYEMRGLRNPAYQEKLQIKRGKSLKDYFISKGIDPQRITISYKMLFADDVLLEYKALKPDQKPILLQQNDWIKIDYY